MRGILISPYYNRVIDVYIGDGLDEIYKALSHGKHKVTIFESPMTIESCNMMYVDEEALFKKGVKSFMFEGYPNPIFGNALILGVDKEGNSCDTDLNSEHIHEMISKSNMITTGMRL